MSHFVELRRARPLLGTFVEITVQAGDEARARSALASAFAAITEVQRLMSFHEAESDVSRLNRDAFRRPVLVREWTWRVLARAQKFAFSSNGAFDITVASLLSQWSYLPKSYRTDKAATFRDIVLESGSRVRFTRKLAIDLGGIAKGFAVDCAIESLIGAAVEGGIVNAGGDLRVFGNRPQRIYLRQATNPGLAAAVVHLQNRALATSGIYFSRKMHRRVLVSPLIDGRTRKPLTENISVAVSALDCLTADALTKVLLARGASCGALLHAHKAEAVILERGKARFPAHAPKLR